MSLQLPPIAYSQEAPDWPRALQMRAIEPGVAIEILSIEVLSGLDRPLLNGQFSRGMDGWFFYTDFGHLPFHIKNIWLQFWFDHGWPGLLLMLAMFVVVGLGALRSPPTELLLPMFAVLVLSVGVLGVFGTPLDSARFAWIFYLSLFSAVQRSGVTR